MKIKKRLTVVFALAPLGGLLELLVLGTVGM